MQGTSRVGGKKKKESKAERFRRQMEEESGAAGDSAKSVEDAGASEGGISEDEVAGPGSDGAEQGGQGDAAVDHSVGGLWALGAVGREAARSAQEKARAARRAQREVVPKWMEAPLDVAAFPAALPVAALPLSPALLGNFAHETLFPVQAAVRPA